MKYETRAILSSFRIIFFCVCNNKIEHLDKRNLKMLSNSFKISMTVYQMKPFATAPCYRNANQNKCSQCQQLLGYFSYNNIFEE